MHPVRYETLVTIATFAAPWEAQLARARLESEGIEARLFDEHLARLGLSNAIGGVRLQVREEDASSALALLQKEARLPEIYLVTEDEALRPRCPGCNSDSLTLERWSRLAFVSALLLFRIPLLIPRKRWRCRRCGGEWKELEIKGLPTAPAPASESAEPDLPEPLSLDEEEPFLPESDSSALVTVARFATPWEAHLARTRLEVEGVEACVHEERLPIVSLLSGELTALNRLEVNALDAPRAREILAAGENRARRDLELY